MSFGKLVFGLFLVGIGALLLAAALGYLPSGVWPWLIQFWPLVLLAFGIALLANALKNPALGVFAVALVLGCFGFGGWWISQHQEAAKTEHAAVIDLARPSVQAVTLRSRNLGGSLEVRADSSPARRLWVGVRGVAGEKFAAHRWNVSKGVGLLAWPGRTGITETGQIGGALSVRAPVRTAIAMECESYLSSARADLTLLRPSECGVRAIGSDVRISIGPARPAKIRITGFLSSTEIRLPENCPVRIEYSSPFTLRSFPEDFLEHVSARVKGKAAYWTAPGSGRPVLISVEGPFHRLSVKREPLKAL